RDRRGELAGGLADQVNALHVRPDRLRERREVLALARAAENEMDGLVRVGVEGPERGGDVGRLRIVDVANAVELPDELEPVRDAREGAKRLGDPVVVDAGGACSRGGGGGVLTVVPAADERLGGERIVGRELDPVETESARDDLSASALEDAQLRVAVRLERAVAVEVVGLEVEQDGDLTRELVHVFELGAGDLADD